MKVFERKKKRNLVFLKCLVLFYLILHSLEFCIRYLLSLLLIVFHDCLKETEMV